MGRRPLTAPLRPKSHKSNREETEQFVHETTIHGFREIYGSRSTWSRLFWIIVTCIGIGLTIWFCVFVIIGFNKRPIITSSRMQSVRSMKLPVIQICLSNPIDNRKVNALKVHRALIKTAVGVGTVSPLSTERVITYAVEIEKKKALAEGMQLNRRFGGESVNIVALLMPNYPTAWLVHNKAAREKYNVTNQAVINATFDKLVMDLIKMFPTAQDPFVPHYRRLIPYLIKDEQGGPIPLVNMGKLLYDLAFDMKDVLTTCRFVNSKVDCIDVARRAEMQGGQQCYEVDIPDNQTLGGFGLMGLINTNTRNAYDERSHGEDALWIRIDHIDPATSLRVIKAPTAQSVKIILAATHYVLTESRYFKYCVDDVKRNVLATTYSDNLCRADCLHASVLAVCNCSLRVAARELLNGTNYKECIRFTDLLCVLEASGKLANDNTYISCVDHCKPQCDYWRYDTTVTYGRFPSYVLRRNLGDLADNAKDREEATKLLDDHILFEIAFDELQYLLVEESPSVTTVGAVSQIGGQLSLFLGCSVLSLVHLTFWIIHGCRLMCCPNPPPAAPPAAVQQPPPPLATTSQRKRTRGGSNRIKAAPPQQQDSFDTPPQRGHSQASTTASGLSLYLSNDTDDYASPIVY